MKKYVPYVNMETVKDADGNIEKFVVRTVSYLPADSKISTSGEGSIADNVYYRPLTVTYTGTSSDFDYFKADFTIERKDVGLLERGVNVKVVNGETMEASALKSSAASYSGSNDKGVIIDYEGGLV